MKKLYMILAAALTAAGANAQSLHLYVGGEEVASGSTIDITKYYDETMVMFNPHLEVKADVDGKLVGSVDGIKLDCSPALDDEWEHGGNISISWCAFGACTMPGIGAPVEKEGQLKAGTMTDMELEYILTLGFEQKAADLAIDAACKFSCTFGGQDYELTLTVKQENNGVEMIANDSAAPEYYDLQGRRVQNPSHGIFIERQGNRVSKRVIK